MKIISEIHNSKHKTIRVFFDDHIRGYLMLKRNSKLISSLWTSTLDTTVLIGTFANTCEIFQPNPTGFP